MDGKMVLYFFTILKTSPITLIYKAFFKFKRMIWGRIKQYEYKGKWGCINSVVETLDFDKEFISRFNVEDIENYKFSFLNAEYKYENKQLTDNNEMSALWLFNLHYFEYIYAFSAQIKHGKSKRWELTGLVSSWISTNQSATSNGWHPYTISVRLPAFMAVAREVEPDFCKNIVNSIYSQYIFLRKNLEFHLKGSNHYLENLKALVVATAFFGEKQNFYCYFNKYINELSKQVNADGMHCELSPMYHRVVLEGAIKVCYWHYQVNKSVNNDLRELIQKMCNAMYTLENGIERIPFFNDSAEGIAKSKECLLKSAFEICGVQPKNTRILKKSGYYVMKKNKQELIVDCGNIGCKANPGHGHCDALSYEMFWDGKPIIVNSGTFTYENDRCRHKFRSSSYHNTVVVNKIEQSEIWSAFRVGRRAKIIGVKFDDNAFTGKIKNYKGVVHERKITIKEEYSCTICDKIYTKNWVKDIKSYIHTHPCFTLTTKNDIIYLSVQNSSSFKIELFNAKVINILKGKDENGWYSPNFGVKQPAGCIILEPIDKEKTFGYTIYYTPLFLS